MSRVSRKAGLSPSITKGSNAINLGKNSGVDMGRKAQPSVTAGGIGITQEVTSIAGVSVSGGVSVDISPIDFGISVNPAENTVSVATGVEIPGGFLGVSGGLEVNTNTGQITGGSIGGEVLGLGINVSNSQKGGLGIEFTVQIPGTPIEFSLGLGFPPKEPTITKKPTITPTNWERPKLPVGNPNVYCKVVVAIQSSIKEVDNEGALRYEYELQSSGSYSPGTNTSPETLNAIQQVVKNYPSNELVTNTYLQSSGIWGSNGIVSIFNRIVNTSNPYDGVYQPFDILVGIEGSETAVYMILDNIYINEEKKQRFFTSYRKRTYTVIHSSCSLPESNPPPPPSGSSSPPPPFPNPPPRKQKMDECCRDTLKLLREIRRFEQETMVLLGRPLDEKGHLIPVPPTAKFFGEQLERIKTPIENIRKPEKETLTFANFYELQMYLLQKQIDLDTGIDPQSFIAPEGKVQNPDSQRDSEESLKSNTQPDADKTGNKRELKIGEDIKINSLSQQQHYIFEALRRLEYLFPFGELFDAKFDKSLIIPGASGELKIHNLIHFQEFFAQYLNATLGDPKIPIKVEDNNALKAGKQEAIFRHFSIAQMIRELYKLTLESGDDINAIMETGIRNFRTGLANRIQIVQIAEAVQALIEDTGMLESQEFIPVKLDGDPYAGKWKPGMGFEPDADLDSNEEAATEKLMRATLQNFQAQVKVIRRDKRENSDIRDLLIQIAEMFIRQYSIPATKEGVEKALAAARFKTQVDMALTRSQVKRAAAASRARTKKRKKT